jgi:hypothetical protein
VAAGKRHNVKKMFTVKIIGKGRTGKEYNPFLIKMKSAHVPKNEEKIMAGTKELILLFR